MRSSHVKGSETACVETANSDGKFNHVEERRVYCLRKTQEISYTHMKALLEALGVLWRERRNKKKRLVERKRSSWVGRKGVEG